MPDHHQHNRYLHFEVTGEGRIKRERPKNQAGTAGTQHVTGTSWEQVHPSSNHLILRNIGKIPKPERPKMEVV